MSFGAVKQAGVWYGMVWYDEQALRQAGEEGFLGEQARRETTISILERLDSKNHQLTSLDRIKNRRGRRDPSGSRQTIYVHRILQNVT